MENRGHQPRQENRGLRLRSGLGDPKRQGGQPTINGTRWPVWHIYGAAEMEGVQRTADRFPTLNRDMVEFAIKYVEAHPEVTVFYADEEG